MAGQYRFKDINGNIVAQISASSAGAISFSGSAVDFSNASTITLGEVQLAGTASNALLLDGFDSTAFVFTSSFNTISQSISSQLITLQTTSGSNIGRLNNLESKSSSVDISISNINSVTASNLARLTNLETKSASVDISVSSINTFTASNNITSLNSKTGSYATTGSNTFFGTQTFSGSVYIANDLIVQGSSSIQYISASSVSIGTNIVQLNTANPSVRFAGLTVIDSGSIGGSGSFLYDSVQDEFIFVHRGNGTNVTSSHFVLGPETYDSLGNETYLTCNIITKGTGKEHLVDSCIFDNGTTTCIKNNLKVTGTACFASSIDAATGITIGTSGTNDISWNTSGGIKLGRTNVGPEYALSQRWTGTLAYIDIGASCQWNGGVTILPNGGGNVGIGTCTPFAIAATNLSVNGSSSAIQLGVSDVRTAQFYADTAEVRLYAVANFPLKFGTNDTERMRITCTGDMWFTGRSTTANYQSVFYNDNSQFAINATNTSTGKTINFNPSNTLTAMAITSTGIVCIGSTASTTYGTLNIVQQSVCSPSFVRGIELVHPNGTGGTGGYIGISMTGQKQGTIQVGDDAATGNLILQSQGGNVGIGTCSPNSILQIGSGGNLCSPRTTIEYSPAGFSTTNAPSAPNSYTNGDKLIFWNDTTGKASIGIGNGYNLLIQATGASNSAIQFFTSATSGDAGSERMRISSGGNTCIYCQLSVGPVVVIGNQGGTDTTVLTGGSGQGSALRMNYAGGSYNNFLAGNGDNYFNCLLGKLNAAGGIKFGSGATTLNYYEQGTWTPRLKNGSFTTNAGVSNAGWYTRIGNLVTVGGTLDWGAGSGAQDGNSLQIACLPFASSNVSNERNVGQFGAPAANSIGFKCTGKGQLVLVNDPGASYIYLIETFQDGSYTTYIHNPLVSNAGTIYGFQITYHI